MSVSPERKKIEKKSKKEHRKKRHSNSRSRSRSAYRDKSPIQNRGRYPDYSDKVEISVETNNDESASKVNKNKFSGNGNSMENSSIPNSFKTQNNLSTHNLTFDLVYFYLIQY